MKPLRVFISSVQKEVELERATVAGLIATRVRDREKPPPFRYKDEGTLATIGRHAAIAVVTRYQ